jgi:hypothetical protein
VRFFTKTTRNAALANCGKQDSKNINFLPLFVGVIFIIGLDCPDNPFQADYKSHGTAKAVDGGDVGP